MIRSFSVSNTAEPQSTLKSGRLGVGRIVQRLAGSSFNSAATRVGSAGGIPSRNQFGSWDPVRYWVTPANTPYLLVRFGSVLAASMAMVQARLSRSSTKTLSLSSTAAERKKFAGPMGAFFSQWPRHCHCPLARSNIQASIGSGLYEGATYSVVDV